MSDQTTIEITAPTVEEAISQGLAQLGLTADAVSIEVLDSASKGLFGLGGRQARVRLTVNPPPLPFEVVAAVSESKPKPREQVQDKPVPAKPAEATPKAKAEPKPARAPSPKKPEAPPKEASVVAEKTEERQPDPLLDSTEAVVSNLILHLGLSAKVSARYAETSADERRSIHVDVRGDDLSALIGRHAETLNAFQHIASLIVGKETQQWIQLAVDVEGYRNRREKQVRQLALRMAEQVVKTGRKAALEPMPSSERRAIHIELRNHPSVVTESAGEEPHRKVVILPKA